MTFPKDRVLLHGPNSIMDVGGVVDELGEQRVLLVRGRTAFIASGADRLLPGLEQVAQVRQWNEFRANTDARDLIEGLRIMADFAPDLVLGVGGGSVMDMAKLLCAHQGITEESELLDAIRAGESVESREPGLILAPTTSGSGSEATRFAVVYIGESKYSVAGPAMLPDVVVLDPELTRSATPYQRATSGIDALAQAVESRWATGATKASRAFAEQAIPLIVDALPRFVADGDAASAADMARGAHLAGRAIDISRTTAAHALSYGFTKTLGLPHGHAVALTLGSFIAAHGAPGVSLRETVNPAEHAAAMAAVCRGFGVDTPAAAAAAFSELAERIGLPLSLTKAGVTGPAQLADLTARVNIERMGNNPVRFEHEELTAMLAARL